MKDLRVRLRQLHNHRCVERLERSKRFFLLPLERSNRWKGSKPDGGESTW